MFAVILNSVTGDRSDNYYRNPFWFALIKSVSTVHSGLFIHLSLSLSASAPVGSLDPASSTWWDFWRGPKLEAKVGSLHPEPSNHAHQ